MNLKREKGFTLIELLVVIAIIAILATLVLIALDGARESARDADRKGAISQVRSASQLYVADNGDYSGMDNAAIGAPLKVQDNDLDIYVPTSNNAFCAVIELSDESRWCTDNTLEVGAPGTGDCTDASTASCGF
jgi:prepilin-type N-terminal cleavage/methylation domain-containing protein